MIKQVEKRKFSQKGLSLIEVLIGVVLSTLIMLALLTLYIAGQKYFFNQGAKADAIQDSSYPNEWIARDIRGAGQVVISHDAGGAGTFNTDGDMLVLQISSVDATETIVAGNFDFIIYRLSESRLERIVDGVDGVSSREDRTRVLADNVNSLAFQYYDTDNVLITNFANVGDCHNIYFEITSMNSSIGRAGQPFQETFRSWAKIRNKAFE